MRRVLAALLVLGTVTPVAGQNPSAQDLAARVQARYAAVKDFSADFTLHLSSELLNKVADERGTVLVKKPGRMRWKFLTGNKNETVSDGTWIYLYLPLDKLVQQTPFPKDEQADADVLFLTGRGDILRDFIAGVPVTPPSTTEWDLVLKPKSKQATFSQIVLTVDRSSLQLKGFGVTDLQGGVRSFRFSNLKENQSIPDSRFVFDMPKGVELRR